MRFSPRKLGLKSVRQMKEVPQLASAVLTILFAAVMFVVGHLYIEKQVDEDSDHRQGQRSRALDKPIVRSPG